MPGSIEDYYQALLDAIARSPIVQGYNAVLDRRTVSAGIVRGDLYFVDGSRLHFRELVDTQAENVRQMYSYHYQTTDASLVFRYDDTPHHRSLAQFPHHKHVGAETNVVSASAPDLVSVLEEIEHLFLDERT